MLGNGEGETSSPHLNFIIEKLEGDIVVRSLVSETLVSVDIILAKCESLIPKTSFVHRNVVPS